MIGRSVFEIVGSDGFLVLLRRRSVQSFLGRALARVQVASSWHPRSPPCVVADGPFNREVAVPNRNVWRRRVVDRILCARSAILYPSSLACGSPAPELALNPCMAN